MLTTEVATEALMVIDEASIRRHSYAMRGMLFGLLGLVVGTLVFGFPVYTGHSKEAYAVLGTNAAGLLLQMIRARIRSAPGSPLDLSCRTSITGAQFAVQ